MFNFGISSFLQNLVSPNQKTPSTPNSNHKSRELKAVTPPSQGPKMIQIDGEDVIDYADKTLVASEGTTSLSALGFCNPNSGKCRIDENAKAQTYLTHYINKNLSPWPSANIQLYTVEDEAAIGDYAMQECITYLVANRTVELYDESATKQPTTLFLFAIQNSIPNTGVNSKIRLTLTNAHEALINDVADKVSNPYATDWCFPVNRTSPIPPPRDEKYWTGYAAGYSGGVVDGKITGFYNGNITGFGLGTISGYPLGFIAGNASGYQVGFNEGNATGFELALANAGTIINNESYLNGYNAGLTDCKSEYSNKNSHHALTCTGTFILGTVAGILVHKFELYKIQTWKHGFNWTSNFIIDSYRSRFRQSRPNQDLNDVSNTSYVPISREGQEDLPMIPTDASQTHETSDV